MKAIAKSGNWEGIASRRETIREIAVGQGRGAQGGRCLPPVLGIFVHGSRPLESGGWERDGAERERSARCRREGGIAARSYRRQSKCNYPPPM